jgi:hypothetical protein
MIDLCSSEDSECDLSEDEKFARKLQKEFDAEPGSVEVFECPVCLDEKPIDSKFIYQNCDHVQCRECASDFFIRQIELKNKINCVLCQQEVATLDLELVLDNELVRKYLKTHNIEADKNEDDAGEGDEFDDNEDYNGFAAVMPTYVVPKRPVKPKAVKRATSKILAPPAKKIAKKTPIVKHNNNIHKIRYEAPKVTHNTIRPDLSTIRTTPSFLDQEYVPGNIESGIRKSYNTPHTRYDRTSSDSDSYEVPAPKKVIRKAEIKAPLKRKLS